MNLRGGDKVQPVEKAETISKDGLKFQPDAPASQRQFDFVLTAF